MTFDDAETAHVLQRFPAHGVSLEGVRAVSDGFSGAGVWCVGENRFALRRWPRGALPERRIRGLHRLLVWIHAAGVETVAVPLTDLSGSSLVVMDGACWQLEPWLPGQADFRSEPSERRLKNVMRVLAQWHSAAATFPARAAESPWFAGVRSATSPAVGERLVRIDQWRRPGWLQTVSRALGGEVDPQFAEYGRMVLSLAEGLLPQIRARLERVSAWRFVLQPCLRDVWHDHILFQGDRVTGVIDPSASRVENVAADLARLLGSLLGDETASWDAALNEYSLLRPTSDPERELVHVLDESAVLLSPLTWLDRRLRNRSWQPSRRVVSRLGEQLVRLRVLATRYGV